MVPIELKSRVELHLEQGAVLRGIYQAASYRPISPDENPMTALVFDGANRITARLYHHHATANFGTGIDGALDRGRILTGAVTGGAEGPYVKAHGFSL